MPRATIRAGASRSISNLQRDKALRNGMFVIVSCMRGVAVVWWLWVTIAIHYVFTSATGVPLGAQVVQYVSILLAGMAILPSRWLHRNRALSLLCVVVSTLVAVLVSYSCFDTLVDSPPVGMFQCAVGTAIALSLLAATWSLPLAMIIGNRVYAGQRGCRGRTANDAQVQVQTHKGLDI